MNIGKENDNTPETQKIAFNGFQQVVEMLRVADPAFRESLLKRIAVQDFELAKSLRRTLMNLEN